MINISEDQNKLTVNGLTLDFFPVKKVKNKHCRTCWLLRGVHVCWCYYVPCMSSERKDKKNGVFSIREMP